MLKKLHWSHLLGFPPMCTLYAISLNSIVKLNAQTALIVVVVHFHNISLSWHGKPFPTPQKGLNPLSRLPSFRMATQRQTFSLPPILCPLPNRGKFNLLPHKSRLLFIATQGQTFSATTQRKTFVHCQLKGQTVSTANSKGRFRSLPTQRADFFTANSKGRLFPLPNQRADFVHCQLKGQTLFTANSKGRPLTCLHLVRTSLQTRQSDISSAWQTISTHTQILGQAHSQILGQTISTKPLLSSAWQTISTQGTKSSKNQEQTISTKPLPASALANDFNYGKRFQPPMWQTVSTKSKRFQPGLFFLRCYCWKQASIKFLPAHEVFYFTLSINFQSSHLFRPG